METVVRSRDERVRELREKTWRVLDTDGKIYEVYPSEMECEDEAKGPRQLAFVNQVIDRVPTAGYTVVSAFHKELRRGDVARAKLWAKWMIHFRGVRGLKDYLRSVVWEETRNIDLFEKWRGNLAIPWEEMIEDFCGSTKKWEIEAAKGTQRIQIKAALDAARLPNIDLGELLTPPKSDKHEYYGWMLFIYRIMETALRLNPGHVRNTKQFRKKAFKVLAGTLRRALKAEGLDRWAHVFDTRIDYDDVMQASEKLCGINDSKDVTRIRVPEYSEIDADIPMPEDYVFDGHTSKGAGLLRRWAVYYGTNMPAAAYRKPMMPGFDLRWSGQLIGVWHRYYGFEHFGMDYKRRSWEDVPYTRKEWIDMVTADERWYGYNEGRWDE